MTRGKKETQKERMSKLRESSSERKKVFKELLLHIASGLSLDCFPPMSESTIKSFLEAYPEDFCASQLEEARRKGKLYWEGLGRRQSEGTCLGNSRSWYYNMSNRYGWSDRQDVKAEHSGSVAVQVVSYSSQKDQRKDP